MGRTVAALIFLSLLAFAGRGVYRWTAGTGTSPDVAGSTSTVVEGSTARSNGDAVPVAAVRGALPPAGPATTPAEAAGIRGLLASGRPGDAVASAIALPDTRLVDPQVARAAWDAAVALGGTDGAGPSDRLVRADAARRLMGRLVVSSAVPWSVAEGPLAALNTEVLQSRREVPGVIVRHTIKPGDTIDRLLRGPWKGNVHVAPGLILHLNSVASADRLRPGPLHVPVEKPRVLVRKGEFRLWFLLGEVPLRSFPVGLGLQGRTPEGRFTVEERMLRPDYWPPGGNRVPFGSPGNPLGTRWLGFHDTPDAQGIGIHGTDEPASIGKNLSQGCVRLLNADVEALFPWIGVGTEVEIRP